MWRGPLHFLNLLQNRKYEADATFGNLCIACLEYNFRVKIIFCVQARQKRQVGSTKIKKSCFLNFLTIFLLTWSTWFSHSESFFCRFLIRGNLHFHNYHFKMVKFATHFFTYSCIPCDGLVEGQSDFGCSITPEIPGFPSPLSYILEFGGH